VKEMKEDEKSINEEMVRVSEDTEVHETSIHSVGSLHREGDTTTVGY
jgi:hypothetical protein